MHKFLNSIFRSKIGLIHQKTTYFKEEKMKNGPIFLKKPVLHLGIKMKIGRLYRQTMSFGKVH